MLCFTENGNMTLTCGICSIGNAMAETRPLFHCYRTMISGGYCVANVPNRTNCVLYGCVAQLDVGHVYVTPWPNPTRSDATHPVEGRDSPPTAVYVVSTRNKMYSSNVCDYVVILPEMRFIFYAPRVLWLPHVRVYLKPSYLGRLGWRLIHLASRSATVKTHNWYVTCNCHN